MSSLPDRITAHNEAVRKLADDLGLPHPVSAVQWIHVDRIHPNDYNPNAVAPHEMRLLHTSIAQDGYTQPIVTIYDSIADRYVIVDGFHRYSIMRMSPDIQETTGGYLPVVVIEKPIADRMASTVRHNRARGKHSVAGMSNLVFKMLGEGIADIDICNRLGLEPEELLRLKHITGFSKLLANHEYAKAWEHKKQLRLKREWNESNPDDPVNI